MIRGSHAWHLGPTSISNSNLARSITSILVCRFMLSLRQFDTTITLATISGVHCPDREHLGTSMVLEFGAQHSTSLPSFVASFAHPVHVNSAMSEIDTCAIVNDRPKSSDIDVTEAVESTLEGPSGPIQEMSSLTPGHPV